MRLDRFLTVHLFQPLHAGSRDRVAILMYHSISEPVEPHVSAYHQTVTTPRQFAMQLRLLQESCEVVRLTDAIALLGATGPAHTCNSDVHRWRVAITFDDGLLDFYTTAFPLLDGYHFPVTVFLSTAFVGGRFVTGRRCMSARQVRELARQGVVFGSHTVSHRQLAELRAHEVRAELEGSRRQVEDLTGMETMLFSYPFRFPEENRPWLRRLRREMAETGYTAGVTTALGCCRPGDDPFFLRRLPVNDLDDAMFLRAKVAGGYDWMHRVQLFYKLLRRTRTARREPQETRASAALKQ
jgi:peptidoglycan/xylan/chitin deacetylase (PgdA/CDA1 family)